METQPHKSKFGGMGKELLAHFIYDLFKESGKYILLYVLASGIGIIGLRLVHTAIGGCNVFLLAFGIAGFTLAIGLTLRRSIKAYFLSKANLLRDCNAVILGWKTLAEDYHNSHKTEGQPLTLPTPMTSEWRSYGHKDWLYPVGLWQAHTIDLRRNMERSGIELEEWRRNLTMAELLDALEKYRLQLS